ASSGSTSLWPGAPLPNVCRPCPENGPSKSCTVRTVNCLRCSRTGGGCRGCRRTTPIWCSNRWSSAETRTAAVGCRFTVLLTGGVLWLAGAEGMGPRLGRPPAGQPGGAVRPETTKENCGNEVDSSRDCRTGQLRLVPDPRC